MSALHVVEELAAKLGLEVDESAFAAAESIMHGLASGLAGIGTALSAYAGGMQLVMQSTAGAAMSAKRAAAATGTSTDAIQELQFAAEASGLSAESLDHALMRLSRTAFEASQGSAEAYGTMRQLGVAIHDAGGKLKPTDALLQDVAAKFQEMPDGIKKTALAQKVFGRSGAELLPFLNKGGDAIEHLREEAHELGIVLSQETIQDAKEFKLANHELEASLTGLKYEIGGPLLKGAGDLARAFAEFVKEHRKAFGAAVRKPYELMRDGLKWAAKNTWAVKIALVALTSYIVVTHMPAIVAAIAAANAWAASLTVAGVAAKALGVAAAALDVVSTLGWVTAVAGLALFAEDFYTFLVGGESVLGDLIVEWDKFYRKLADDPHWAENHPILAFFAAMLDSLLHLNRALREFESWFEKTAQSFRESGSNFRAWIRRKLFGESEGEANAAVESANDQAAAQEYAQHGFGGGRATADMLQSFLKDMVSQGANPQDVMRGFSEGGVAPSLLNFPMGASPAGGKFNATIHVTPPPGGSPQEYGRAVTDAFEEWYNASLQEAEGK